MGKSTGSGGRGSFNRRGRTFAASVRLQEQITSVSSQLASARAAQPEGYTIRESEGD